MHPQDIFEQIECRRVEAVVAALAADPNLALARHLGLGSTPLHFAAHRGLGEIVHALLEAGAEVDAVETASGTTALHWAAEGGHASIAQALLERGARHDVRDEWFGLTPLGWATVVEWTPQFRDDRARTVERLEAAGAVTDVFVAIARRNRDLLERVIGADPEATERRMAFAAFEMTPLHLAAVRWNADVVAELLAHGADPEARTNWGLTPLALTYTSKDARHLGATANGFEPVREVLTRVAREDPSVALVTGDLAALPALLEALPGSQRTEAASALLHAAAARGLTAAIEPLVRAGARIDATTRYLANEMPSTGTALHLATLARQSDTVAALLRAGAHPDPGAERGEPTPLHLAASQGDLAVVRALLAGGADVNARESTFHATPLGWAEHCGNADVVEVLRQATDERRTDGPVSDLP